MTIARSEFYPEFFRPGIRTLFFHLLDTTPIGDWPKITTVTQSDKDHEVYANFGNIPEMVEFKDERQVQGFGKTWKYEIWNKKYELTLGVRRDELEDELYGVIRMRIGQMAQRSKFFTEEQVFTQLNNGHLATSLCWDGSPFFDTDGHKLDGATAQVNCTDTAFGKDALITTINTMRRYKDDKGKLLKVEPDTILCGPELFWTITETLHATSYVATGVGNAAALSANYNVLSGIGLNIISTPMITSTTAWYLMDTKKMLRPVILQERTPLEFAAQDQPTNEDAFMRDMYKWGLRVRFGLGYGDWTTCFRGKA